MIYMFYFFEAKLWFDLREVYTTQDDVSCYFWEMIYVYETFVLVHRTLEGVIWSSLLLFSVLLSKDQGYFCNNKQLDHFCKNPLLILLSQLYETVKKEFYSRPLKLKKLVLILNLLLSKTQLRSIKWCMEFWSSGMDNALVTYTKHL